MAKKKRKKKAVKKEAAPKPKTVSKPKKKPTVVTLNAREKENLLKHGYRLIRGPDASIWIKDAEGKRRHQWTLERK